MNDQPEAVTPPPPPPPPKKRQGPSERKGKPSRAQRRRKTKNAVVMTPAGPRAWPSKGKIKKNKGAKLRQLRVIANGRDRGVARRGEQVKELEEKRAAKQYARQAKKAQSR